VALRLKARIFAEDDLLEQAAIEIAEEELVETGGEFSENDIQEEVKPSDLKEYLRKLNPEDFGRFTP